jgi:hypothetical protein
VSIVIVMMLTTPGLQCFTGSSRWSSPDPQLERKVDSVVERPQLERVGQAVCCLQGCCQQMLSREVCTSCKYAILSML